MRIGYPEVMDLAMTYEDAKSTRSAQSHSLSLTDRRRLTVSGVEDVESFDEDAVVLDTNGGTLTVLSNAQDAVGDTMNAGTIVVHGSIGDAAGYAMRGGKIYVRGNAGYRAGIHMKAYQDHVPVIVIGGRAGTFLGEYQAGGLIIVLGLHTDGRPIVSNFPCTGMHGGKLFLRSKCEDVLFPEQVTPRAATPEDLEEITGCLKEYCGLFGLDLRAILDAPFTVVTPNSANPYKQMYVAN